MRKRRHCVLLLAMPLFALPLFATVGCGGKPHDVSPQSLPTIPTDWVDYKSPDGKYSIYLPRGHLVGRGATASVVKGLKSNVITANGDDFALMFDWATGSMIDELGDGEGALETTLERLLAFERKVIDLKVVEVQRIRFRGLPARQLKIEQGGGEQTRHLRIIRHPDAIIQVAMTHPSNIDLSELVDAFFDSLRFGD